ncbi:hypothetical protein RAJCM14343_0467 [Rhodococcus aetherivorans]|uniref:VWA7 N-terminal domain-containing protein n=1 Tax=Rhodococcus aetherivorans TaxID=191292 RepID=A0ABQ0YF95_9NOCA|nr:hypothetical protein [Rhodococcus aetherivorans]ETT25621.1 hypothetical protein RR21198_0067 [Rhodococcus rhodochrous ATCC 21198]WFS13517.1 hypothetical protein P9K37_27945 [Rhodococcus aetherivorans]GES35220.1 hypothetical protein RAJCM14343_0467 [Rhodococcus aetherivorans]
MTLLPRPGLSTIVTVAAAALLSVSMPPNALAFAPDIHGAILRAALPPATLDGGVDDPALAEITGSLLTGTGNEGSDLFQGDAFRHFDNAARPADVCDRARDAWNFFVPAVIAGAQPTGPPEFRTSANGFAARSAFGGLTHALADFYSHSNWVELAVGTDRAPGLAPLFPTCDPAALPAGLHTGFFELTPANGLDGCPSGPPAPPAGSSVPPAEGPPAPPAPFEECHLTLNKDDPGSLRGREPVPGYPGTTYHQLAVQLAVEHTTALYREVRGLVAGSVPAGVDGECVADNLFRAAQFAPCAVPAPTPVLPKRVSGQPVGGPPSPPA